MAKYAHISKNDKRRLRKEYIHQDALITLQALSSLPPLWRKASCGVEMCARFPLCSADFCSVCFFFSPKDEVCAMMPFTGLSVFTAVESIHLVTSLAVQWLRLCFQCRGQGCHPCLVEELRPFLLCCATKNKIHLVR